MTDYPEHAKLLKISKISQAQGDFIEWLEDKGIFLAVNYKGELLHNHTPIKELLAEYHGIDRGKIEDEKRDMIEQFREASLKRTQL